jgi:small subunit ribosomal protein S1
LKEDEERKKPKEFRTGGESTSGQSLGDILKQKLEEEGVSE